MNLLKEIDEIGKVVNKLRKENTQLIEKNRVLTEKENKTRHKLKRLIEIIDNLLSTQGKILKK
ncbi:hypothetical protein KAT73_05645 [candidate division WOR-3 bacterium]|nr:hypothetical protein [candidate division WOR-3 bacterium]